MIHIALAVTEKTDCVYTMRVCTLMDVFTASNFKINCNLCLPYIKKNTGESG